MNNVYSCAHVAVLFRAHGFFRMRSVEEELMHACVELGDSVRCEIEKVKK